MENEFHLSNRSTKLKPEDYILEDEYPLPIPPKFKPEDYILDMTIKEHRELAESMKYCYEMAMFFGDHFKEIGDYKKAAEFYEGSLIYRPNDEVAKFKLLWVNKSIEANEPKEGCEDVIFKPK